jgi:hypothetical protein
VLLTHLFPGHGTRNALLLAGKLNGQVQRNSQGLAWELVQFSRWLRGGKGRSAFALRSTGRENREPVIRTPMVVPVPVRPASPFNADAAAAGFEEVLHQLLNGQREMLGMQKI